MLEPDDTWKQTAQSKNGTGTSEVELTTQEKLALDRSIEHKLIDSATGIAATLNNIGPGLGIVGAKENYAFFSAPAKLLFTLLMMIGRLEIFVIAVLFVPGFWRLR